MRSFFRVRAVAATLIVLSGTIPAVTAAAVTGDESAPQTRPSARDLRACKPRVAELHPTAWSRKDKKAYGDYAYLPGNGTASGGVGSWSAGFGPHSAQSSQGLIVGTSHPTAIHAGRVALENCGTAMDAALAASFMEIALAAGSYVSFGGITSILAYDAKTEEVTAINGNWNTFLNEKDPATIPPMGVPSGRSALVPGFMAAAEEAHERFGSIRWAELFDPAIHVAEAGMQVTPSFEATMQARAPFILRTEEGRKIFLKDDGMPYLVGDTFRQPEVAGMLRNVASSGASYMYEGPWAKEFVRLVNREGGAATREDLARYEPLVTKPSTLTHGDYRVSLPTVTGEDGIGPDYASRLMRKSLTQVRKVNLPKFGSPYQSAQALAHELRIWRETEGFLATGADSTDAEVDPRDNHHSAGLVVADRYGNVVAITHSINTVQWGSNGIFVEGVAIPDAASFQQSRVEAAGRGGRMESDLVPTLILDDGDPVFASSAIGTGLQPLTFVRLADFLEYDTSAGAAARLPAFHYLQTVSAGEYDEALLAEVRLLGEPVSELPYQAAYRGGWVGLSIDPSTGKISGGTTSGFGGMALEDRDPSRPSP